VIPSGLVAAIAGEYPTAQKIPRSGDQVTSRQFEKGIVCEVHMIPSGLVAATVPLATAQKIPRSDDHVIESQVEDEGRVR